jgi:glycosyltransferase involved in cell wall biosynthesis
MPYKSLQKQKIVSVIIPARNEEVTIVLQEFLGDFEQVHLYRHIRNMGMQGSILSGLKLAKGHAAVILQSDLQDPPELIFEMIEKWRSGANFVATKIRNRNSNFLDRTSRTLAYLFLNSLSAVKIQSNAGDFWLIDRKILDQLILENTLRPFFRTAIPKIQNADATIVYDRRKRKGGNSNFNFIGKYEFFVDALLSDARKFSMMFFLFSLCLAGTSMFLLLASVPVLISDPPDRIHHFAAIFSISGSAGLLVSAVLFPISLVMEYVQRVYSDLTITRSNSYLVSRKDS